MANGTRSQPGDSRRGEFRAIRRRNSLSGIATFLLVVASAIFVMSVLFRVSIIEVVGNEHYTDEEIISASGIEPGDNLFFFDRFAVSSRVFAKLPYVEEFPPVERRLPNKVVITVVECKALACINVGDEYWTVDHNCKILGKATELELSGLIPIYGFDPGTLLIGEKLTEHSGNESQVDFLITVLTELQERGLAEQTQSVSFTEGGSLSFRCSGKYEVVIGWEDKVDHKFAMVMSVLEQLKSGDVGTIDVSDGATAHFIPNL